MKEFTYHEPTTLKEAVSLLNDLKDNAKLKAGGTDLLINMKKETITPKNLINLKNVSDLAYIDYSSKDGLRIGALATLREIESSAIIRNRFNILWQAACKVASTQVRSRATLGGNICLDSRCPYYNQSHRWLSSLDPCYKRNGNRCYVLANGRTCYSVFSADSVPALIALEGKIKLLSFGHERVILLKDFYTRGGRKVNKSDRMRFWPKFECRRRMLEHRVFI